VPRDSANQLVRDMLQSAAGWLIFGSLTSAGALAGGFAATEQEAMARVEDRLSCDDAAAFGGIIAAGGGAVRACRRTTGGGFHWQDVSRPGGPGSIE